ncbi:Type I restriction-modification system, specificity subunit S [Enhygromyxa salina]|uniref:Type I restriction-modification system, specificity subunit S n=1 Tax=Enhygromyxa salina TaxID=215803 RepID=A0A0C1Z5P8_9BACT|nr:Type I restriction-modification system, specificity subunit S [Enhygromyxa salina]
MDNNIMALTPLRVVSEFLYYWSTSFDMATLVQPGALPSVNQQGVGQAALLLPPIGEQRKIAAILSSVDEAIEKTQGVIDQVQVVKKGLMQELLTRGLPGRHKKFKQTEIGEIPASWEVVELQDVATVRTGIAKNKKNAGDQSLPYLRVANVQDGYVDLRELKTIRVNTESVSRYELRAGDVLFTEGGDADKLGRGAVWDGSVSPCLHQNHVFAVATHADRLCPWFLSYYGSSERGKKYFLDSAKQTTNLASINSTQLKELRIPLPSVDEQRAVIARISLVQARIANDIAALDQLTTVKQALMSVLLTGELRVNPTP